MCVWTELSCESFRSSLELSYIYMDSLQARLTHGTLLAVPVDWLHVHAAAAGCLAEFQEFMLQSSKLPPVWPPRRFVVLSQGCRVLSASEGGSRPSLQFLHHHGLSPLAKIPEQLKFRNFNGRDRESFM